MINYLTDFTYVAASLFTHSNWRHKLGHA